MLGSMKVVDLTLPLDEKTLMWPGAPQPTAQTVLTVAEHGFMHLDAPVSRLTMPDVPSPHNPVLVEAVVPSAARIRAAIDSLLEF